MYLKLQALLPNYTIEPVTMENLSFYESVFYNNKEYYHLTDGHDANRDICEDTICGFTSYNAHNIGISQSGEAVSFLNILVGYPDADTLYIGLLLVDDRFKRQSVGTSVVKALITLAAECKFKNLRLSVQENNINGLNFWKKLGFYEINRCVCEGFDNLSMKYDIE